jgi:hypothetical protein
LVWRRNKTSVISRRQFVATKHIWGSFRYLPHLVINHHELVLVTYATLEVGFAELLSEIVVVAVVEVIVIVVVLSLQPNHPGVLHVEVDVVVVTSVVLVLSPEVVLSKHPHHPGVWHVAVLVLVNVELDGIEVVV